MLIDRKKFFDGYRSAFGPLTQQQVAGWETVLHLAEEDRPSIDTRQLAYILATLAHETGWTIMPIEEYGKGDGKSYGSVAIYKATDGQVYRNRYYGRGYVQLTWLNNYLKLGSDLGVGDLFARNPALVMESRNAWRIMVIGMTRGRFTGKALDHYIHGERCDYRGARRVVNGTDQAAKIAGYATKFESILRAAIIEDAGPMPLVTPVEMEAPPSDAPSITSERIGPALVMPAPDAPASPPVSNWRTTAAGALSAAIKVATIIALLDAEVIPAKYKPFIAIAGGLATVLTVVRGMLTADVAAVEQITGGGK